MGLALYEISKNKVFVPIQGLGGLRETPELLLRELLHPGSSLER